MLVERVEAKWIDVFREVFDLCRVATGDEVVIPPGFTDSGINQ